MNRLTDMDINVAVRRVLVRHWIELGRISVRTTRGVVWLTGSLVRMKNGGDDLTQEVMLVLLQEIKTIDGVRRLNLRLLNFEGNVDAAPVRESVTQSGTVNTYEAKMTGLSLRDVLEALDGGNRKPEDSEGTPNPARSGHA